MTENVRFNMVFTVEYSLSYVTVCNHLIISFFVSATKVAMAKRFNDPNNSCNVLVATDAVGMGLNL